MRTLEAGEVAQHRWVSFWKRLSKHESATYWLTVTMPWKQQMYDVSLDEFRRAHPMWCIGFRFHRQPK
jgi:hypothetical protein